jgi:hypothetical protein
VATLNIFEDPVEARAWGVLFALSLRGDGTIRGRVTLNKTMAMLQRDGFPIRNKFITKEKGPYDQLIHKDAKSLERGRMIEIEEKETRYKSDVTIYHLRDEGLAEVQKEYAIRIESLPYRKIFKAHLEEIQRKFSAYTTPEIVEKVHHELLMDIEDDDAEEEMEELVTNLMVARDAAETDRDRTCFICLNLLGSLDFAVTSLGMAIKKTVGTKSSSKNLIYFNAKEILRLADRLSGHDHMRYSRPGEGPLAGFRDHLGYRLYCAEQLSDLYEIVKPIRDELSLKEYIQTVSE